MRFITTINNVKANEWDLTIQEAYLFAWFYELPSWADKIHLEGEVFYFASKVKAVEELPILTDKVDTMYRHYKTIEAKGLIVNKKFDGKDYVCLTQKAKSWNYTNLEIFPIVGKKSEDSEKNPTQLGKKSEDNSEKNPTYNNISNNKEISNNNTMGDFENFSFEEKQTPVKEKKEIKKRGREQPSHSMPEHWDESTKNAFGMWLKYKTERKDFYSDTGLTVLVEKLARFPNQTVVDAIENSISNNWAGLFPEKVVKLQAPQKPTLQQNSFNALKNQFEKNGYELTEEIHPSLAEWKY